MHDDQLPGFARQLERLTLFPYIALFVVFALGALLAGPKGQTPYRGAYFFSALLVTVMVGLRFNVGGDWITYNYLFQQIATRPLDYALTITDPGYGLLNWLTTQIGMGVWFVNLICAAIFSVGLISLCKLQPNPPLALLVAVPYLVIVVAMGYTRQSAAIGFMMLAVTQLHRGSMIKMAALLLFAVLFHRSAVLTLPLFALSATRHGTLGILLGIGLAFAAFNGFLSSRLDTLVQNYIGYAASGAMIRVLMTVLAASLFLIFRQKFEFAQSEKRLWTLFSLAAFAALGALLYAPSSAGVDRAALYLIPLQVVVFSRIPTVFSATGQSTLTGVSIIVGYSALVEFVWLNFGQFSRAWLPYQNYLVVWLT